MKLWHTFAFTLFTVQQASGQGNIPFPTQNAVWNVSYSQLSGTLMHTENFDITYFTAGDTIINGNTYTILRKNVHSYVVCIMPWVVGCASYEIGVTLNTYAGAYRENALHQILYIDAYDSVDCVLLDYGLTAGDTISKNCPFSYSEINPTTIGNTDSVLLLDGLYHMRQEILNSWPGGYLIEGVGSTYGFLEPLSYFENGSALNCLIVNGVTVFTASGDSSCQSGFAGINETPADQLVIHPVPATDQLNIKSSNGCQLKNIELFDLTGRKVFEDNPVTTTVSLSTTSFTKGCYFIRITDQLDRQTTKKIVLQ